ncbi:hypothetical protein PMALA_008500 [Plasmodium malariae]|uniref:Uncharacterized protein n=1 Tax=Plasmodium malariae TaxID=5858 RepID=A0A1A8VWA9_PLAMA|nr:hypothetical protein PMALA_008500 [Plasmodium malariae]
MGGTPIQHGNAANFLFVPFVDFYIMKDFQKRGLGIVIKKYYGKMGKIQNAKTIKRQSYDDKAIMTKRLQQSDYDKTIKCKIIYPDILILQLTYIKVHAHVNDIIPVVYIF